jgi:hypothetical protein
VDVVRFLLAQQLLMDHGHSETAPTDGSAQFPESGREGLCVNRKIVARTAANSSGFLRFDDWITDARTVALTSRP